MTKQLTIRPIPNHGATFRMLTPMRLKYTHFLPSASNDPIPCSGDGNCRFCMNVARGEARYIFYAIDRADGQLVIFSISSGMRDQIRQVQRLAINLNYSQYDTQIGTPYEYLTTRMVGVAPLTPEEQVMSDNIDPRDLINALKPAHSSCINNLYKRYVAAQPKPAKNPFEGFYGAGGIKLTMPTITWGTPTIQTGETIRIDGRPARGRGNW